MIEFWKDGQTIRLFGIYKDGLEGQVVIYTGACWGKNVEPEEHPLCKYPRYSIFTIVSKTDEETGYYILKDSKGQKINVDFSDASYLYDAQEWLNLKNDQEKQTLRYKKEEIERLQGHIDLLKDILIKQGIRTITEKQAETLGISLKNNK